MPDRCLSLEQLGSYLRDSLSAEAGTINLDLEEHLHRCKSCEQALSKLVEETSGQWATLRKLLVDRETLAQSSQERNFRVGTVKGPEIGRLFPADSARTWEHLHLPGYQILDVIGRGASATVYRARQQSPVREVALKLLDGHWKADSRGWKRFQAEIETIVRLSHPNVVRVLEVVQNQEQIFFTMPLVAGGSLADRLNGTPWPPRVAAWLVRDLALGAGAAHRAGIVHRDIKPGNVLMSDLAQDNQAVAGFSMTPQLTDFGVAKTNLAETDLTRTGEIVGTPSYMAPEQILGHQAAIGPATDVYALGCILYELLTGRPPFRLPTATETMFEAVHGEILPPTKLQSRLPRNLVNIVLKALSREPTGRYANGDELASDLQRFLNEVPVLAQPVTWLARSRSWVRRHPAIAVAILTCGAASILLLALWGRFTWRLKQERDEVAQVAKLLETEKSQAVLNFERAFEAIRQYLKAVQQSPQLGGETTLELRRELIGNGVSFYEDLLAGNQLTAELPAARLTTERVLLEQARLYFELAKMSHQSEDYATAIEQFSQADRICFDALGKERIPSTRGDAGLPGAILLSMSKSYLELGNLTAASESARQGRSYFERIDGSDLLSQDYENWYLAESWLRICEALLRADQIADAVKGLQQAQQFSERLPAVPDFQYTHAQTLIFFARPEVAENPTRQKLHLDEALRLAENICQVDPSNLRYLTLRAVILTELARASSGETSERAELIQRCLQDHKALVELRPKSKSAADNLKILQKEFGKVLDPGHSNFGER